jgi:hypothetical protein
VDELSTYDPFATADDFAKWARRNLNEFDTASVELYLGAASTVIREFCEWQVWPQLVDDVLTLDGPGAAELILPVRQVAGVSAVAELGTDLTVDGDSADFDWSTAGILTRRYGWWTARRRGIVAVVTHGWVTVPTSLVAQTCAVAGRAFASPLGATREQAGAVSVTYSSTAAPGASGSGGVALTDGDRARLAPFRGGYR